MARTVGIILVVVGAIMLAWTGFSFTRKEKVVDIGSVEISADKKERVNWSPYVGGIILVAGVVLLVIPRRR
ncbi:hypothetical protein JHJ32_02230 [Parapedobacter sp. ISTM3]|uniref:DUF3185 domain-containing protein n=1 Tax=Parapedobacter luteus TaxID=623280 RepID=A0A1T4ZYM5_9SPHI|nr:MULTISPECIES: hypothetical protein [Parapedobacter]MBK1438792.1 hypothetical protein [Parapedobacter sp. ISTM3]SKB27695.1 hypothetical protein SAMN05660226_00296 [Parapedobacter luteus]